MTGAHVMAGLDQVIHLRSLRWMAASSAAMTTMLSGAGCLADVRKEQHERRGRYAIDASGLR